MRGVAAESVMPADRPGRTWWRDGVLYQIYPRSYMDANGDGVGDLRGITSRLDHLAWLGVEGIWLSPITVSPNRDWGYDVADYCDVDPALGTLADAEELIAEAAARGIRVLLDLVPNHSSDQHPWFVDARSGRDAPMRDRYVWADPGPDGGPPNNWVNQFDPREPAWTFDEVSGQWYLNQFLSTQPDLNWWNDDVRDAFDDILRFWFDRGVAGFRIDVCHAVVKDRELRDNPPCEPEDHWWVRMRGQRSVYNACRPELHDVLRRWRAIADEYTPHRILLGETYVFDPSEIAAFYGDDDELNLAFDFALLHSDLNAAELRRVVETAELHLPPDARPVWTAGNHDNHRFPTRWCAEDPARVRAATVMLLGLRGTPVLYYGDEIGMPDTPIPDDRMLDPVGRFHGPRLGRDAERTPMHWAPGSGAGFSVAGVEPWLPYGDPGACNVADQRDDPGSVLHLTRDLIALRAASDDLRIGAYSTHPASDDRVWIWRRGTRTVVACNLSDTPVEVPVTGRIEIATDRTRDGETASGSLRLDAWSAAIVVTDG